DQGWSARVHDVDRTKVEALRAAGAIACADAAEAARGVGTLIVCVIDAVQTRDVLFGDRGALDSLQSGGTAMLCPTIAPQDVEDIARELATRGVDTIDAPMSGGPTRARDGSMSLMVACADAVFAAHDDLIAAISGKVFRIGERPGD